VARRAEFAGAVPGNVACGAVRLRASLSPRLAVAASAELAGAALEQARRRLGHGLQGGHAVDRRVLSGSAGGAWTWERATTPGVAAATLHPRGRASGPGLALRGAWRSVGSENG